ncbi:sortase [Clostridium sp. CTA-19]
MSVKKILINGLAGILLISGIAMIAMGTSNKFKTKKAQDKYIQSFEKSVKEGQIKDITVLGILEIPNIGLKVAVKEGTEEDTIDYAVGHFLNTAMAGENGNFALAGHRNYSTGEFFLKLDQLKKGDIIEFTTYDSNYTYEVSGSEIVKPNNMDVLKETSTPTITLVTCSDDGSERLIIKGNLKK